ncbi:unnamed protein product [Chrysoparadoxa australica]
MTSSSFAAAAVELERLEKKLQMKSEDYSNASREYAPPPSPYHTTAVHDSSGAVHISRPGSPSKITLHRSGSIDIEPSAADGRPFFGTSGGATAPHSTQGTFATKALRLEDLDEDLSEVRAAINRIDQGSRGYRGASRLESRSRFDPSRASPSPPSSYQARASPSTAASASAAASASFAQATGSSGRNGHHHSASAGASAGVGVSHSLDLGSSGLGGTGLSNFGPAHSSKAVLSALRALQDKVRKLEQERDKAKVECRLLEQRLTAQQASHDTSMQREVMASRERQTAARLAYERLAADKSNVDVRLAKAEEKRHELRHQLEALERAQLGSEASRKAAEAQTDLLRSRVVALEAELKALADEETQGQLHVREVKQRQTVEVEEVMESIRHMEATVAEERSARHEAEAKLADASSSKAKLEAFLHGVLQVNEALVTESRGGKSAKKVVKSQTRSTGRATTTTAPTSSRSTAQWDQNISQRASVRTSASARGGRDRPAADTGRTAPRMRRPRPSASSQKTAASIERGATASASTNGSSAAKPKLKRKGKAKAKVKRRCGTVPFMPAGTGKESYNVLAAVNEAVSEARIEHPTAGLDILYGDLGESIKDAVGEVPLLFRPRDQERAQQVTYLETLRA